MNCEKADTCCFTGPRSPRLPCGGNEASDEIILLKKRILEAVENAYEGGIRNFISGMAEGFDLFAAEAVICLMDRFNNSCKIAFGELNEILLSTKYDIVYHKFKVLLESF